MELYEVVVAGVIAARFLVPLLIPVYPLPGILAALVLDASDRAIFAQFVEVDVERYQTYDKALDIYYLSLAFVATLRNWSCPTARRVAAGLWYIRLVGVALFEVTGVRWLLFIFPNTFEYFFIAYETVRLRWDASRLRLRHLLAMAAGIWVFLKMPQEYWVHIAQRDTTDFIKVEIVGAPLEMPWIRVPAEYPWVPAVGVGLLVLLWLGGRALLRVLPPPHRSASFHADAHPDPSPARGLEGRPRPALTPGWLGAAEQVALVALMTTIFAGLLPAWEVRPFAVGLGAAVFVAVNAGVSISLGRRGVRWRGAALELAFMGAVNLALVLGFALLSRRITVEFDLGMGLFFAALFTLIITLHDRYRGLRGWWE
ncbi:MAG: hypothetical protein EA422_00020, partial [Gemmatimonadales bacterium]